MVLAELSLRLNEVGYKNWLKAGYCLMKLKDGLQGFVNNEMKLFHERVINNNAILRRGPCRNNCRAKGNQLHSLCSLCSEWRREILRHHTNPSAVVNWSNCRPWLWSAEHWELAKAFMPRGQADVTRAEQCDAAALLNLLHFCDHFSYIDPKLVKEVIRCRNELMHSCEMRVSAQWMRCYQRSLEQLLQPLQHVPEVAVTRQDIQETLSIDWSVHVPGVDRVDGSEVKEIELESISQWETGLLRERLHELLLCADQEETLSPEDQQSLQTLSAFLQNQEDLKELFKEELETLHAMGDGLQRAAEGIQKSETEIRQC
ncbi:uncharacterized protein CXorf38-like isoform X1 [Alosa sapidissima]|uniref:uncharacterized protein CXorf38-like isoform X1 n=2 Tax=Alosa sapidissima TaxID=34773 RepID=UPI001C099820|nr:uncharacterized protein CXorf38-like isoform X1 [Alosa sapidissima]